MSNPTVGGRLDDYHQQLFDKCNMSGKELLEFALDILAKKDPSLIELQLNKINEKRRALDLEEASLKKGINIGIEMDSIEIPVDPIDSIVDAIEEFYSRLNFADYPTIHDMDDNQIAGIIKAYKSKVSVNKIRDILLEKYPLEIDTQDQYVAEIDKDHEIELNDAVKVVKSKFERGFGVYKKKFGWETFEDVSIDYISNLIRNYDVEPEEVLEELVGE